MLRKILLASVATATIAGSAFAADLPSRKAPPPAYIPPPIMTWTGFYVGINGGAIWSDNTVVTTGTDLGVPALIGPGFSAAAATAANNVIRPNRIGGL